MKVDRFIEGLSPEKDVSEQVP